MSLQGQEEIVQPLGISRTDLFYRQEFLDGARRKLYEQVPEAKGKKVLLYAPTFRGRVADAVSPQVLDFPCCVRRWRRNMYCCANTILL